MIEIWKVIKDYPDYMVSNLGRVKSLWFGKEKILKGANIKGYLKITLCKEGKQKQYLIHRLVATAFIPNPNNLPEINHIDEDKTNNRVENLEWCNRSYNVNYGSCTERMAKAKSISIIQFTKNNEFVRRWNSAKEVERELGIHHSIICMCCKGKQKTAYGYKWGYEKDYERIQFKVFDLNIYEKIA